MSVRSGQRPALHVRHLGRRPYEPVWRAMQAFSAARTPDTPDELWLLEHPPVYTQGLNGKPEHLLAAGDIPVVAVDRGGQVTYHGPGQLVGYLLLDLARRGTGVRWLVEQIEGAVITLLEGYGVQAHGRRDAPGVYVGDAKVAALGLRVRHGRSYHGLSLNLDMDLGPFGRINPCGYAGMPVTQLRDLGVAASPHEVAQRLVQALSARLGCTPVVTAEGPSTAGLSAAG